MKKILFVNSSLTSGGSERVMTLLANEFASREYDVDMVLLYNYGYDTYQLSKNVNLIRFYCESRFRILKKVRQVLRLRRVIKNTEYDCIISFMQSLNIVTLLACLGLKKKVIVSERCNPKIRKNVIKNFLSSILYNKAAYVVLQTEQVKDYFKKSTQDKTIVISNPVNNNMPKPYRGKRKKKIVGVGRLTEQKNFELLIDGFVDFHHTHNDYILEIYGEGPLLSTLKKHCIDKKIENSVYFMGYIDNVLDKIKSASMYVSTSNYEGISNAMIEALAMGIPTICTDCPVGGAAMMIKNNENGILISLNDKEALISAMNQIADDNLFANKISTNAIKVRDKYALNIIADKWEKIIK